MLADHGQINSRVLCIEDNPPSLRLIAQIIENHTNYDFLGALSPGAGLDLAGSQNPDVILLDINLPGMDGFEVFRRLRDRSETREIPVIAISANAMPAIIEKATSVGFLDYLTKPIDPKKLLSTVEGILGPLG